MRAEDPGFGVYVHFPYCRKRCPYCDFAVSARRDIPHERYLRQVLDELALRAGLFPGRRARSVYFGGGTPSLWRPECVGRVIAAVLLAFPPEDGAEITVECDPKDLEDEVLAALRKAGANRISLGVQSLEDRHLVQLGRLHDAREAIGSVARIRRAGFDNLSLDLMIGLCGQSQKELQKDLAGMLALAPDHVSLYQLTVEPRTALAAAVRKGLLHVPENDVQADFYEAVHDILTAAGYLHYEISSFARNGKMDRRAVHNRLYWTSGEYLGLGVSAHSFRRLPDGSGERFANPRGVEDYLAGPSAALRHAAVLGGPAAHPPPETDPSLALYEHLLPDALAREALWLGLRQLTGLSRARFHGLHGYDPVVGQGEKIERLRSQGLLDVDGDLLRLSRRGVLLADEVGVQLL